MKTAGRIAMGAVLGCLLAACGKEPPPGSEPPAKKPVSEVIITYCTS